MATTPARQRLRSLLNTRELVIAPGVFDGISAQLTKRTGHVAAYLTGSGVAASGFGLPDIGLVTASEMAERARMVVGVLGDIPLIADADTGYGDTKNVVRTVRSYDNAGVAAIQLEDQVFPKRCGHLPDKRVVDAAVFEQTLAAALDTRSDDDLLIVARTDARAPLGLDAAIERANRYAAAGADIIFVEAPRHISEIRRIATEVQAPLLINLVIGGLTPQVPLTRLQELGYAVAIHPSHLVRCAAAGMLRVLCELNGTDAVTGWTETPSDFFTLVGLTEWSEIEARFTSAEAGAWA
ncbi:isocitrate lyase/PEP mutase family protein [Mycobacterium simiae]|uniref:Isocitrate lyase/PEP mutase family protein n=1 Tax=Mycobacterium simiae TaxID=1784 RepID=A0A5B1BTG5_MYCSI|nr:isocitrate lyase/PEP mutase family protein [Mycobacterium simiae]KAA1251035.1 isocitrate lyase/PEP mutase family protein [Mycobacterium simiae]